MENSQKMCAPAMLYFVVAIIVLMINFLRTFSFGYLIVTLIIIMLWSWFLNFLCNMGFSLISWILVVIPFLTFLV
jgi:hypothetical protein